MDKVLKINKLMAAWPQGAVMTTPYLSRNGFYYELLNKYKNSGWIQPLSKGAYFRPSERYPKPTLAGALHGLLKDGNMDSVHLGGQSALEFHGSAHFIQSGPRPKVWLFAQEKEKLPAWFKNYDWRANIKFHSKSLFKISEGVEVRDWEGFEVNVSSRERAIIEVFSLIPHEQSLDHGGYLMQGLGNLRPSLMQTLLENCRSFKAKRLVLATADMLNYSWLKSINTDKLELGSGTISLKKGFPIHAKYRISVPKVLKEEEIGL